jgi:hypothetical protein
MTEKKNLDHDKKNSTLGVCMGISHDKSLACTSISSRTIFGCGHFLHTVHVLIHLNFGDARNLVPVCSPPVMDLHPHVTVSNPVPAHRKDTPRKGSRQFSWNVRRQAGQRSDGHVGMSRN